MKQPGEVGISIDHIRTPYGGMPLRTNRIPLKGYYHAQIMLRRIEAFIKLPKSEILRQGVQLSSDFYIFYILVIC